MLDMVRGMHAETPGFLQTLDSVHASSQIGKLRTVVEI